MRPDEREVAGLTCSAVMAALSDYVDGDISAELRERIETHVAACRWCERFGADFVHLLMRVQQLSVPDPVPVEVARRLRERVASTI